MTPAAQPAVPLWRPSQERVARAAVTRFATWVGLPGPYERLWRWSVDDIEGFWRAIWDFFEVQADGDPSTVLRSRDMPGAAWFPDVRLSYAEHVFRGRDEESLAIQYASELHPLAAWSWSTLRDETARAAAGLRALGVVQGDRVAAYLPNTPETVAAFLATAAIGATWSSAAPEFGARAVLDRFAQVEPKVLLATDGYRYGGRDFDRREAVAAIRSELPTVEHLVLLEHLGGGSLAGALSWEDLRARHEPLHFERVPFDHPLWVLYTSGTTGLPKPIVHGHGGILLEHLKALHLHIDAQAGDRLFWFTTTGWMMWNFLVGGLLTPASIILYDGSPTSPSPDALWDLAESSRCTCFGTSAPYIAACMKSGVEPRRGRDLSRLTAVGSTASPLAPEGFRWVYDRLGADVWLFSMSGGTDLCTAFVAGAPTLPVHAGELQCRALGADVQAWDAEGQSLVGAVGELVIAQPMPSMPVSFWGDADGSRLHDSYFAAYPGVWRHGDWIELTERGSAIIYGRSDATINRAGVRIGTSEIYRAVLSLDEVLDALVVDVPRQGGASWMPLFVVLRPGQELTDDLAARIRERVRADCSPRHVPDDVYRIAEVPRTLSGKALEVPVKRILMGVAPDRAVSRESLANPAALDAVVELAAAVSPRPPEPSRQ